MGAALKRTKDKKRKNFVHCSLSQTICFNQKNCLVSTVLQFNLPFSILLLQVPLSRALTGLVHLFKSLNPLGWSPDRTIFLKPPGLCWYLILLTLSSLIVSNLFFFFGTWISFLYNLSLKVLRLGLSDILFFQSLWPPTLNSANLSWLQSGRRKMVTRGEVIDIDELQYM